MTLPYELAVELREAGLPQHDLRHKTTYTDSGVVGY